MSESQPYMIEGGGVHHESTLPVVQVDHVSMIFNIANQRLNSLKEYFISLVRREFIFKEFKALDDVSFQVNAGDVFGIIGTNGSGKSTLLKIIAGVLEPTKGSVETRGHISPLIELGAGFDYELTAVENIYLNGALLGYPKKFIDKHFDEIVDFAEVEDFMEMPLKNFSSGMVARIAFAIATVMIPDILIVDEVLSVGDFAFKQKCERRIRELIEDYSTTVLIVSHSDNQIEELCDNALWIDHGHMRMIGKAKDVCKAYRLLGAGAGDEESEAYLMDLLSRPSDDKAKKDMSIAIKDRYEMATELARRSAGGKDFSHIVIASGAQFDVRIMATAFANALNAPLVLTSPTSLNSSVVTLLCEKKPDIVTVIQRTDSPGALGFDIEAEISSVLDCEVALIQAESHSDLSEAIYDAGEDSGIWGNLTLSGTPSDAVAAMTALPFLHERHPFVYLYDKDDRQVFDAFLKRPINADMESIPFYGSADKARSNDESRLIDYCLMNHDVIESMNDDAFTGGVIFATAGNMSHAIAALQFAISQGKLLALYDAADVQAKVAALRRIGEWDVDASSIVFIGSDSDLSTVDKEILRKSLRHGGNSYE